ncbi:MAG: ABC transporter ATP-binding protein [Bacteroidota bacterium]
MQEPILSVRGLTKKYGPLTALNHINLEIEKGQVFGILGPNGSGKTTTLGILLNAIHADEGNYFWFGETPTAIHRRKIGAILEEPVFYPYLNAVDNLKITSAIKHIENPNFEQILKTVDLFDRRHDKIKTYSFGMKQRLAIAGALVSNPDVLILDEPTNGLDPQGIAEIRNLITEISGHGITIILASHMLDEVQKVCTHVAILQKGKKLTSGSVEEVLQDKQSLEIDAEETEKLQHILNETKGISSVKKEDDKFIVVMDDELTPGKLNKWLIEKGVTVTHLAIRKKSLEKYFLDLTSKPE